MVEVGLAQREMKKWKTRKPVCQKSISNTGAVTFFEIIPSLLFLIVGILLSLLVFFIELLTIKCQQKRKLFSTQKNNVKSFRRKRLKVVVNLRKKLRNIIIYRSSSI